MKSSLWIVVVVVSGLVGFLLGYSVSGSTGSRGAEAVRAAQERGHAAASAPAAAGQETAAGYAAPQAKAGAQEAAAGYAAPQKAPAPPQKAPAPPAAEKKTAAGGY